jgi:GntR family transcriptional regulator/MocR family aminotransferase
MPKDVSSLQLALHERPAHSTLTSWLYQELRGAILERRLPPGTRLPATRDFALQYGVSRGTVVTVFEQLQAEGYLIGRVGQAQGSMSGCRKTCSKNRHHNRE